MRFAFALVLALCVVSALFSSVEAGKKKRILRKLVKGALVAKVLKPKFLPLPIPLPIPIPIGIEKHHHAIPWPAAEPVWGHGWEGAHHGGWGGDFGHHGGW